MWRNSLRAKTFSVKNENWNYRHFKQKIKILHKSEQTRKFVGLQNSSCGGLRNQTRRPRRDKYSVKKSVMDKYEIQLFFSFSKLWIYIFIFSEKAGNAEKAIWQTHLLESSRIGTVQPKSDSVQGKDSINKKIDSRKINTGRNQKQARWGRKWKEIRCLLLWIISPFSVPIFAIFHFLVLHALVFDPYVLDLIQTGFGTFNWA